MESALQYKHGLNIYKDTKPSMSSLLVINRVYRYSHVGIFDPSCELAPPLTFSLVHLPPPPLPCVN